MHPERVVLSGGRSAAAVLGAVNVFALGGVSDLVVGWMIGLLSSVGGTSMYAVFTRSIETVSVRPFFFILIVLSPRLMTSNGPSYGACSGLRTASCLTFTYTCVDPNRFLSMYASRCETRVAVGRMRLM